MLVALVSPASRYRIGLLFLPILALLSTSYHYRRFRYPQQNPYSAMGSTEQRRKLSLVKVSIVKVSVPALATKGTTIEAAVSIVRRQGRYRRLVVLPWSSFCSPSPSSMLCVTIMFYCALWSYTCLLLRSDVPFSVVITDFGSYTYFIFCASSPFSACPRLLVLAAFSSRYLTLGGPRSLFFRA